MPNDVSDIVDIDTGSEQSSVDILDESNAEDLSGSDADNDQTPSRQDEDADAADKTGKSYSDEDYQKSYERLLGKEKLLDEKLSGVDKWMTKNSEELKSLREEMGVQKAHEANKDASATAKKLGVELDADYIGSNPFRDEKDTIFKHRVIPDTPQNRQMVETLAPLLDTAVNAAGMKSHQKMQARREAIREEFGPPLAAAMTFMIGLKRHAEWGQVEEQFFAKYPNLTEAQKSAVNEAKIAKDGKLFTLIDSVTRDELLAELRKIAFDPEVVMNSGEKKVLLPRTREGPPNRLEDEEDLTDSERAESRKKKREETNFWKSFI